MKKVYYGLCLLLITTQLAAQKQHFDLVSYTPPKGWKKELSKRSVVYSINDTKKKTWCVLAIYGNTPSKGDIDTDLLSDWNLLSATPFKITEAPVTTETTEGGGWKIKTASGKFKFNNTDAVSTVTTMTGFGVSISVQANTNSQSYLQAISTFIGSFEMDEVKNKPVEAKKPPVKADNPPAKSGGFAFFTTNFDDGWTSTVKEDWAEVTKGNVRVLIHYPNKEADAYQSVLKDEDLKAWNVLVAPRYSNLRNFEWKSVQSWQSISFMEGDLTENSTGKNVHVVLFKMHYSKGNGRYMEFITNSKSEYEQAFGPYHQESYGWDSPANMQWRNKFAVSASDLIGKWGTSDYASLTYYYVNTGGTAGTTATSTTNEFTFLTSSTYQSEHNGASGMVGNMKFSSQTYKGTFSTTNWDITMTNRFEGKPEKFSCQFEAVKGGRILVLTDRLGTVFTLGKIK
jgi:hypothetical protein